MFFCVSVTLFNKHAASELIIIIELQINTKKSLNEIASGFCYITWFPIILYPFFKTFLRKWNVNRAELLCSLNIKLFKYLCNSLVIQIMYVHCEFETVYVCAYIYVVATGNNNTYFELIVWIVISKFSAFYLPGHRACCRLNIANKVTSLCIEKLCNETLY